MRYILAFLLATTMVLAATPALDQDYITIVGADSPSSDVITAANFAATMTALDVRFTGAIDEDALAYYDDRDLDDKYIVVIDDESVFLLGTSSISEQVEKYFNDLGFDVRRDSSPELEDLIVTANWQREVIIEEPQEYELPIFEDEEPAVVREEIIVEQTCDGCKHDERCYSIGDLIVIDNDSHYCGEEGAMPKKELRSSCTHSYECLVEDCRESVCGGPKKSVVERFFTWLSGFF